MNQILFEGILQKNAEKNPTRPARHREIMADKARLKPVICWEVSGVIGWHPPLSKADSTKAIYRSDWWNLIHFVTALLRQPVTPTFAERG